MSKYIILTKSKYKQSYFGLKVNDICINVGYKNKDVVVYRPFRDVKTNLRPMVLLKKDDCKYEEVDPNFIIKIFLNLSKWLVVGVVKAVNTKGITPYKKLKAQ